VPEFPPCVSGWFVGGLLPVLQFCRQKRPPPVFPVRVMRRYGKYIPAVDEKKAP